MIGKINIKDYEKQIEAGKYEEVFKDISQKSLELAKEIGKIKDLQLSEDKSDDYKYFEIEHYFDRNFGVFRNMFYLMRNLQNWNCEDDFFDTTEERKLEYCINNYNPLVDELERYRKTENEIKKRGFETLCEERLEQLKRLYYEMLEYKGKAYDGSWSFRELSKKIVHYYNFYQEDIYNVETALLGGFVDFDIEKDEIPVNEVERIMYADDVLDYLTPTKDYIGYEADADAYPDYELKEGQTYSDLYDEKKEKLINLLKAMLDFIGVEVTENDNYFNDLRYKVAEYYPFYEGSLSLLRFNNPNETYISKFDTMDKVYERLSNDYKNYKKNMEEYKKEK